MGKWAKWLRPSTKSSTRKQTLFTSNNITDDHGDDFYHQSGGFIVPPQNALRISTSSEDIHTLTNSSKHQIDDDIPKSKSSTPSIFPKFLTPKHAAQWRIADSNQLPKQYDPRNPSTDSSTIPFYNNNNQESFISNSTKDRLQSINKMKDDDQPEQSWLASDIPDMIINDNNNNNNNDHRYHHVDDQDSIQPASYGRPTPKSDGPMSKLRFHRHQQKDKSNSSGTLPNRIIFARPNRPGYSKKSSQDPLSPPLSTHSGPATTRSPVSPLLYAYDQAPRSVDNALFNLERRQSIRTNSPMDSAPNSSVLEKFLPHRPPPPTSNKAKAYSSLAPAAAARIATQEDPPPEIKNDDQHDQYSSGVTNIEESGDPYDMWQSSPSKSRWRGKNQKKFTRGSYKKKARDFNTSDIRPPSSEGRLSSTTQVTIDNDEYFGTSQHDDPRHQRLSDVRPGEEVLLKFLKGTLGPRGQTLAVRLMNKTPIKSISSFTYSVYQGTEESDLEIIRRDLTGGRLYSSGVRLIGGAWCNLLLGDRFQPGASKKQRHELTYRRTVCSCLNCSVQVVDVARQYASSRREGNTLPHGEFNSNSDETSTNRSTEVLSTMSSMTRTPMHSAMANFVVKQRIPALKDLIAIGASVSSKELEIGTVVRLNYRSSAKLKFTSDVSELFQHLAYTGPISHEEIYRQVTTRGVHYYLYNKGKKERKVYLQGHLVRLPIPVGVIKLGTQPMHMKELGATFLLHRKQIMSIYIGQIVLEGNSLGSFIKTGIEYFIGFGEERGVAPVYPNKTLGKTRKLGINELLLHHHMISDLEVKCI